MALPTLPPSPPLQSHPAPPTSPPTLERRTPPRRRRVAFWEGLFSRENRRETDRASERRGAGRLPSASGASIASSFSSPGFIGIPISQSIRRSLREHLVQAKGRFFASFSRSGPFPSPTFCFFVLRVRRRVLYAISTVVSRRSLVRCCLSPAVCVCVRVCLFGGGFIVVLVVLLS